MGRFRRRSAGLLVMMVIGLGGVGCAGDGGPPSTPTSDPATLAPTDTVDPAVRAEQALASVRLERDGSTVTGTGVAVMPAGHVMVGGGVLAEGDEGATVTVTAVEGSPLDGTVLGLDPRSGIGVVVVDPTPDAAPELVPTVISDRDPIEVGDPVALMSALPGQVPSRVSGEITATRQIMPGSGVAGFGFSLEAEVDLVGAGPLFDDAGEVVGLLASVRRDADGSQMALAVGSAVLIRIVDQLLAGGEVVYPFLGLAADETPADGAAVTSVVADGPAAQAGLQVNDVIIAVGDRAVEAAADIVIAVHAREVGDELVVTYLRDGVESRTTATLTAAPST